jgi:hypothetical protein
MRNVNVLRKEKWRNIIMSPKYPPGYKVHETLGIGKLEEKMTCEDCKHHEVIDNKMICYWCMRDDREYPYFEPKEVEWEMLTVEEFFKRKKEVEERE